MKKMLVFLLALALMVGCVGFACAQEQKPVILMVSFGTSYNESRDATIGAVEAAVQAAYPEYEVRRAFTAQTVIDILRERDGLEIDNVTQAISCPCFMRTRTLQSSRACWSIAFPGRHTTHRSAKRYASTRACRAWAISPKTRGWISRAAIWA